MNRIRTDRLMTPSNDKKQARLLLNTRARGGPRLGHSFRDNAKRFCLLAIYYGVLLAFCVFSSHRFACGVLTGLMLGVLFCLDQQFRNARRCWPFYQKVMDWDAVRKIAETETISTPPVLEGIPPANPPVKKGLIGSLATLFITGAGMVILVLLVPALLVSAWFWHEGQIHITTTTDQFHVTVLSVDSRPGQFAERLRVECPGDMTAKLQVTDLKEAGIFPIQGAPGEGFYRLGNPEVLGGSVPVTAHGSHAACEIFFRATTTATNTLWHDEMGGAISDTSLPTPLTITQVRTNWPGTYASDAALPLAHLGDYVILLSVR